MGYRSLSYLFLNPEKYNCCKCSRWKYPLQQIDGSCYVLGHFSLGSNYVVARCFGLKLSFFIVTFSSNSFEFLGFSSRRSLNQFDDKKLKSKYQFGSTKQYAISFQHLIFHGRGLTLENKERGIEIDGREIKYCTDYCKECG